MLPSLHCLSSTTTAFSALVAAWPVSIASSRRLVLPSWYSRMTPWSFSSAWSTSIDSAMRLFCQARTSAGAGLVADLGDVLGPQLLRDPMHLRIGPKLLGRPGVELHELNAGAGKAT